MKHWIYIGLLFGSITTAQSQQSDNTKWTLQACVEHGIKNNISIKNAELDLQSEDVNKRAAIGGFLPNVNASANHSWNIGLNQNFLTGVLVNQTTSQSSGGLNVGLTLFNGLQNQNQLRRANLSRIATTYNLDRIKEDVALNVANAYLQILFNKENIKIVQQQLKDNETQYQRIQQLVTAGQSPKGELLNLKAAIATNKQQLLTAENNLYISKVSLAQLLQLENPEKFDIADTNYEMIESDVMQQNPEAIFEIAKKNHISIKYALSQIDVAEKDIKIVKGARSFSVSSFYNFNTRASYADVFDPSTGTFKSAPNFFNQINDNKGHNFGFSLNVPVFNGFSARNAIDRSKIALERTKINAQSVTSELEKSIHIAYADTKSALEVYKASKITVEVRKEAYQYAKDRFEVGMNNSYDVTQLQTLVTTAETEVVKAKYDYIFKSKILELYFGIKLF